MHYVIGDVHGCYDALQRLLEKIQYSERDVLWFVGDLVNRGPDSLKVLRMVRQLPSSTQVVLGNHDLHFLAVYHQASQLNAHDTLSELLAADDIEPLVDFLCAQKLFHYDESLHVAMVHAGLPPQWTLSQAQHYAHEVESVLQSSERHVLFEHLYGDTPDIWDERLAGWDRLRVIINYLTRMRFCDGKGRMNLSIKSSVGSQPEGFTPWFDVPNRAPRSYPVIFGHWAALQGRIQRADVQGIDGGCVWGGQLMALCLQTGERFSVDGLTTP